MSNDLTYELRDGVAHVIFNRPQVHNALTVAMYERLAQICASVKPGESTRVVLIAGAGEKAFAAGSDISQLRSLTDPDEAIASEARLERVLSAVETCPVPTIAAMAGVCMGGGAAIAACCDMRIGAGNLQFGVPIARTLGNTLSLRNYARLSALIGPARVKDMIFRARAIDAREAHAIGLLNEVVEDSALLMTRALEVASLIGGHAPLTLSAVKEAFLRLRPPLPEDGGIDLMLKCYRSSDYKDAILAFLEKRSHQWLGK
jgi:enoyl-CoA hydratase/carnithine racemase